MKAVRLDKSHYEYRGLVFSYIANAKKGGKAWVRQVRGHGTSEIIRYQTIKEAILEIDTILDNGGFIDGQGYLITKVAA
jgi:hypothetical protein